MGDSAVRWGEYYMERTPEEIRELRSENRAQNLRLEAVERGVTELRVALVGIDDNNGLRGELRDHKNYTRHKLDDIEQKIDRLIPAMIKSIGAVIASLSALAALVWTMVQLLQ
jgi:hypothetical protein